MFTPRTIAEKKSTLFSTIVFAVVGVMALPIIIPHLFHGYHLFHILLHVAGIIIAVFLTVISYMAYRKMKTKRLLFTTIAFGVFIAAQNFSLIEATWPYTFYLGELAAGEAGHMLILAMLGIFTLGVFRND